MGTTRAVFLLLAVLPALRAAPASAGDLAVDVRNDASMAVSVPLGSDNGVTRDSDFRADADGVAVPIYPDDIYEKRFWSQPLSEEAYRRVRAGTPVTRVTLDNDAHLRLRVEGEARKEEYRRKWEAAKRDAERREADALRLRKASLEERRDALEVRIAEAEQALADEEGRAQAQADSEERDIDRAVQNIQDYEDRRDELQEQRNAMASRRPVPRDEMGSLTLEIRRLNDRIASERETIRIARDRKRSARTSFLARKTEWQNLVADRKALDAEIRALERKIRELSPSAR